MEPMAGGEEAAMNRDIDLLGLFLAATACFWLGYAAPWSAFRFASLLFGAFGLAVFVLALLLRRWKS